MYLRVEHKKKEFKKTWKLESSHKIYSLGHSRQADLRLDAEYPGIAGVLQFSDGHWSYTHLIQSTEDQQPIDRFIPINGPTVIPLKEGELCLYPYDKKVQLFNQMSSEDKKSHLQAQVWLVWRRNKRVWYSEFCPLDQEIQWPHNKKSLSINPKSEWQDIENDGIMLSYKLTTSPETKGFNSGAVKMLFDPSVRPYLLGALIACSLTGLLSMLGQKENQDGGKTYKAVF